MSPIFGSYIVRNVKRTLTTLSMPGISRSFFSTLSIFGGLFTFISFPVSFISSDDEEMERKLNPIIGIQISRREKNLNKLFDYQRLIFSHLSTSAKDSFSNSGIKTSCIRLLFFLLRKSPFTLPS